MPIWGCRHQTTLPDLPATTKRKQKIPRRILSQMKGESRIDDILKGELEKYAACNADATEAAAMGLAPHRLEHLIAQRRTVLNGKPASTLQP
jgi:hypothetical protein